jgi:mannosyl-oligosaccharide alpha-1,2-mannosidase
MYLKSADVVRKWLLYRPMLPGGDDVLFTGSLSIDSRPRNHPVLRAEVEHLTCFIGGMIGMGSKIFDLKDDLALAEKLTDGCVWAYGSMPTGIMPEGAVLLPCESLEQCAWNETAYYEYLDPRASQRDRDVEEYLAKKSASDAHMEASTLVAASQDIPKSKNSSLSKRQVGPEDTTSHATAQNTGSLENKKEDLLSTGMAVKAEEAGLRTGLNGLAVEQPGTRNEQDPLRPLTHKEWVDSRIEVGKLPPGYVSIRSKKYSLR